MKVSVILKTTQDLGDHGREVIEAIDIHEDHSIKDLVNRCLKGKYSEEYNYSDHIEIRMCKQ